MINLEDMFSGTPDYSLGVRINPDHLPNASLTTEFLDLADGKGAVDISRLVSKPIRDFVRAFIDFSESSSGFLLEGESVDWFVPLWSFLNERVTDDSSREIRCREVVEQLLYRCFVLDDVDGFIQFADRVRYDDVDRLVYNFDCTGYSTLGDILSVRYSRDVDRERREVDGCNGWRRIVKLHFPQLCTLDGLRNEYANLILELHTLFTVKGGVVKVLPEEDYVCGQVAFVSRRCGVYGHCSLDDIYGDGEIVPQCWYKANSSEFRFMSKVLGAFYPKSRFNDGTFIDGVIPCLGSKDIFHCGYCSPAGYSFDGVIDFCGDNGSLYDWRKYF